MAERDSNGGFFYIFAPSKGSRLTDRLREQRIQSIRLKIGSKPLVLARVPQGGFGWFDRKTSEISERPFLISHSEFKSLITKSSVEEKWTLADIEVSGLEPREKEEIDELIVAGAYEKILKSVDEKRLFIGEVELFDSKNRILIFYGSGIVHLSENPERSEEIKVSVSKALSFIM